MEKARHILLLREKLQEQNKTQELSKLDKEASNMWRQKQQLPFHVEPDNNGNGGIELTDKEKEDCDVEKRLEKTESQTSLSDFVQEREKQLATKCLKLLMQGHGTSTSNVPKVGSVILM